MKNYRLTGNLQADLLNMGACFDPITAVVVGLSAVSAMSSISEAKRQAKATIKEGNINLANKAKEVRARTAAQQVSFLQSGLTLEGTPMGVIDSTFNTGITDLTQMKENYDNKAANQIRQGRTQALSTLAGSFGTASFAGGFGDLTGDFGSGFMAGFENPNLTNMGFNPGLSPTVGPVWADQPLAWRT
jgi:hypothetical protein